MRSRGGVVKKMVQTAISLVGNRLICFILVLGFQVNPVMNELSERIDVELNASRLMYP